MNADSATRNIRSAAIGATVRNEARFPGGSTALEIETHNSVNRAVLATWESVFNGLASVTTGWLP